MEMFRYSDDWEKEWERFVEAESINGTFLQTRRFINYHPVGKFVDHSLLFVEKGKIKAVCPACEQVIDGEKVFHSHGGMTFGGIMLKEGYNRVEKLFEILDVFEKYLRENEFDKVILKIVPDIFSAESPALLEYSLHYYGYREWKELNTYVNLKQDMDSIWNNIDRNKKRTLKKAYEQNLIFREIRTKNEIEAFYLLLVKNLLKYDAKPIHSLDEILEFANWRLKTETKFYGVFDNSQMLAGGMLFSFSRTNVLHAQNLSADTDHMDSGAITLLYYSVILEARRMGYDKLSWGISTEEHGAVINKGLIRNKESYGSEYYINHTFIKSLKR